MSSTLIEGVDEGLARRLIDAAREVREMAYAPYSNFKVGAAILARSGRVFTGCNVENSSYGGTCCAERVALFKAVSEGEREFIAIALVTEGEDLSSPCGICRQVLSEFGLEMKVFLANTRGQYKVETLAGLMPYPFLLKAGDRGG